jgi:hydroxymethylglutaryl-CoA reductase
VLVRVPRQEAGFMPTPISYLGPCPIWKMVYWFWLEIPLALWTVGGLTSLHPGKLSLEMLENPSARELMQVVAVAGLAQNFAALRSLTNRHRTDIWNA